MINEVLLYLGSSIIMAWGIAHIAPIKVVVKGFGHISLDNRRIITMEWLMEGLMLVFIGLLVMLVTALSGFTDSTSKLVYRLSEGALIAMAAISVFTGARTKIIPMKV